MMEIDAHGLTVKATKVLTRGSNIGDSEYYYFYSRIAETQIESAAQLRSKGSMSRQHHICHCPQRSVVGGGSK